MKGSFLDLMSRSQNSSQFNPSTEPTVLSFCREAAKCEYAQALKDNCS